MTRTRSNFRPLQPISALIAGFALLMLCAAGIGAKEINVPGNPNAPVSGIRRDAAKTQPATLHPVNATDLYGNQVLDLIYESMINFDIETFEPIPLLAQSWEVSEDKRSFTFHIDPRAKWSDGKPLTAEDVKFSFDLLFHKKLKTRGKWMSYYGNFESPLVLDSRTIRFTAKVDHFLNFNRIGSIRILPKHKFKGDNPNKVKLAKKPMGSGPILFGEWRKGAWIKLKRNKKYWGRDLPQNRGQFNHNILMTKFIPTDKVTLESFKRGDVDLISFTPEQWVRETGTDQFSTDPKSGRPLIKMAVNNRSPRSYGYIGYNLESPQFSDRRVRTALSHLLDRDTFIQKFYHGFREKTVGPFAANSPYSSPKVKPIEFSVRKAIHLMAEAGWKDTDGDKLVDKDGNAFRFTVLTPGRETALKILTLAKESMRKAGVELNIKVVDWSTLLQLIDEFKFDAVMLGWTRAVHADPTALWHSKGAVKGGLNFVHYRNKEVDKLIDQATKTIPEKDRVAKYRRIHEIIFRDQPYTFLLEPNRNLIGYQSKFEMVKPWYTFGVGYDYWWTAP